MVPNIDVNKIDLSQEGFIKDLINKGIYTSHRQNMSYVYTKKSKNRKIETYIFSREGKIIAGAHYSLIMGYLNLIKVADLSSGFIFRQQPDAELLSFLIEHFSKWAATKKTAYARINPWYPKSYKGGETESYQIYNELLHSLRFNEIVDGRHTYWIDLTLSEEDLLKKMKRQTRYDVRQGIKSDIKIKLIENSDKKLINSFWNLYMRIGKNKQFAIYSEEKFKSQIYNLLKYKVAILFVMIYDNEIINISIASHKGIASYLHGAININFKKFSNCPSPGPYAQWLMISKLKERDVKMYDMGFCPGKVPYKEHSKYGIWRFKYGFGGEHVQFMPVFGKVLKPVTGRIFKFLRYRK